VSIVQKMLLEAWRLFATALPMMLPIALATCAWSTVSTVRKLSPVWMAGMDTSIGVRWSIRSCRIEPSPSR
jgi:predicted signal transduction protein with EAL and GGDEF domain